jgi:hypothetical protein
MYILYNNNNNNNNKAIFYQDWYNVTYLYNNLIEQFINPIYSNKFTNHKGENLSCFALVAKIINSFRSKKYHFMIKIFF